MIVADESDTLQKCLESAAPFVDAIYLTSTQASSAIRRIAERFHAQLRSFAWVNDFSAARSFSISDVTEEWILCLDAGDVFPPGEAAKIRAHLGRHATAYTLHYQTGAELTPAAGLKIFRNHRGIRYEGIIHEHLRHSLSRLPGTPVGHLPIHLVHTGCAEELQAQNDLRNLPLLRRELQRCLRVGDAHQLLHVGNSLATSLQRTGQPRRAEALLRWLIQRLHKFESVFSSDWEIAILSNYLALLQAEDRFLEALELCRECASLFHHHPLFHLYRGIAHFKLSEHREALDDLDRFEKTWHAQGLRLSIPRTYTAEGLWEMQGHCHLALGDYAPAMICFKKCAAADRGNAAYPVKLRLAHILSLSAATPGPALAVR